MIVLSPKVINEQRARPRGWYVRLFKLGPQRTYTPAEAAELAARNIHLSYAELETKAVYDEAPLP